MSSDSRSRRRGVWSHWVPLAVTITVATVGIAAWAWSQRQGDEEEEEEDPPPAGLDYENADYGENPAYGASDRHLRDSYSRGEGATYGVTDPHAEAQANAGWGQSMSGALRRTPSPQQFLSNAGKAVTAGVGAVGAAMGSALAAIREEDKTAYADHETWSQEAESRREKDKPAQPREPSKRRKTVAVVVSADTNLDDLDEDGFHEHASILSHIPRNTDFSKIKLFILIYSPGLKDTSLDAPASNLPPASLSSSFSNISHNQAQTPGDESKSPLLKANVDPAFNAVYSQALGLVEKESMIMPFTTENGHVHILHHLQPEVVYLQESLAGDNGLHITRLQSWLRYDVILVVGADGGHGGLADSESEAERPDKTEKWWQREDRVGRGRGVVVVDSLRVGDDWARRVQGKE
ncbi:hypothetical protein JX265_012632 [Neoarthrinium moseri]|uniref:Peroxin 22-like protein n=1 Tax=Neoarthrinium moseri TaxID=1658444 RepID=A0A9Q0AJH1_9PEZI|nr:uncharacterized protein JN550_011503 [Neoarthrinium moseri]KAI1853801.1 hypothetical protein JX265_012632 [Neoarthrinium moseri]KAI1860351.1 hypothetical protein JN550_011503 [Neoarthrinium moseri]